MIEFLEEYSFKTVDELFDHVAPWGVSPELDSYVFRGHSQESYTLVPSARRHGTLRLLWAACGYIDPPQEIYIGHPEQVQAEYHALRSFYRLADQRGLAVPLSPRVRDDLVQESPNLIAFKATAADEWIPTDMLEAAALAQHYGIPTSLLDWTYDIYVAMYFAFKGAISKSGNMCIWCINKDSLSLAKVNTGSGGVNFVTPHYAGNPHLFAQKGLFTHYPSPMPYAIRDQNRVSSIALHGLEIDRRPLDVLIHQNLKEMYRNIFKKFILPCSEAIKGCQILEKLGYDASRIYPGYGGVAEQILTSNVYQSNWSVD